MPEFLGIDTSNYTTSAAIYNSDTNELRQSKLLLNVKSGEKGLRQSNVVFDHLRQLPEVIKKLSIEIEKINAIGVSSKPRNVKESYMPCFICGEKFAEVISDVNKIQLHKTSHQAGHMLSALYSAGRLDLIDSEVLLFHVSGGTTECLLCKPAEKDIVRFELLGTSLDLKAGQLIDRVGIMLGLKFPCGKELEELASRSTAEFRIKPVIKGINCCLSGVENICEKKIIDNEKAEDIAKYVLTYINASIESMTSAALKKHSEKKVLFAGGVMSNRYIRKNLISKFDNIFFAEPEFSCDNAAGAAIFASIKNNRGKI